MTTTVTPPHARPRRSPRPPPSTRADRLAHYRDEFVGAETSLVYFDGNSLGRPPRGERSSGSSGSCASDWGGRLIRGWDESWMQLPVRRSATRSAASAIGAAPGQTVIGDSTTVLLYKLIRAAFDAQHAARPRARARSWSTRDNFPTDRYLVEGIAARARRARALDRGRPAVGRDRRRAARRRSGPQTAVVVLSHVAYRSGYLADAREPSRASRTTPARSSSGTSATPPAPCPSRPTRGGSTSRSAAPTSTSTADRAPPRSPTSRRRHQAALAQPIQGWMGTADVFAMGPEYAPGRRACAGSSRARRRSSACSRCRTPSR